MYVIQYTYSTYAGVQVMQVMYVIFVCLYVHTLYAQISLCIRELTKVYKGYMGSYPAIFNHYHLIFKLLDQPAY